MRKPKRLPLEALAPYLLELPDPPVLLDWPAVFGNHHPVEVEIGFGKGAFLVAVAPLHPETNYLGVEIDRGLQLYVATRVAKRELRNVKLARTDARLFIRDYIPSESVRAVHVYFPDPWWKKRHRKRRVFTEEFAAQCERMLVPGGRLHLATDVGEYFGVMTELLAAHTRLRQQSPDESFVRAEEADYLTNFERKAKQQGRSVWRAVYDKPATGGAVGRGA